LSTATVIYDSSCKSSQSRDAPTCSFIPVAARPEVVLANSGVGHCPSGTVLASPSQRIPRARPSPSPGRRRSPGSAPATSALAGADLTCPTVLPLRRAAVKCLPSCLGGRGVAARRPQRLTPPETCPPQGLSCVRSEAPGRHHQRHAMWCALM